MDKQPEGKGKLNVVVVDKTQFLAAMVLLSGLGLEGAVELLCTISLGLLQQEREPGQEAQPSAEAQQKAADAMKTAIERAKGGA